AIVEVSFTPVFVNCIGFHSIGWPNIDTITTIPLALVTSIADLSFVATPATSNATSTPLSVYLLIISLVFDLPQFIVLLVPTDLALLRRSSDKSKKNILLALAALAAIVVNNPIGPAPKIASVSPNRTSPSLIA